MSIVTTNDQHYISIADAIRSKGVSGSFNPAQMASAIELIRCGADEVYFTSYLGIQYTARITVPESVNAAHPLQNYMYMGASALVEYIDDIRATGASAGSGRVGTRAFDGCSKLKTCRISKMQKYSSIVFKACTALETVQLGSIGYPVVSIDGTPFTSCTQADLIITIYTSAATLADVPAAIGNTSAPWGATNATIIYRNSNTGEVITA